MPNIFYVYEWWRPDKDVCFYVGKGKGYRAWEFRRRNTHCSRIIAKLVSGGNAVDVRIIASGMDETAALAEEVERIAFWRANGVRLSNRTFGGEGVSGLKHSEATRLLLKAASSKRTRKPLSEETKRKIGEANRIALTGRKNPEHSARLKGRKHTEEHKAKISAGMIGRQHSNETRAKIGAAHRGRSHSDATKEKFRQSHLGQKHSAETVAKRTASVKLAWTPEMRARKSEVTRAIWANRKAQKAI